MFCKIASLGMILILFSHIFLIICFVISSSNSRFSIEKFGDFKVSLRNFDDLEIILTLFFFNEISYLSLLSYE